MEIFIIIYIIISTLLFIFFGWAFYKLNLYVGKLEEEIDEVSANNDNTNRVLEEALNEDYLEKGKTLKIKKPRISKNEI